MTDTIALYRKFGLHASADALQAKLTCRTCAHLDTDPKEAPCAGCRDFERWQDARADGAATPVGGEVKEPRALNALQVLERMDYRPGDRVLVENFLAILWSRGMWVVENPLAGRKARSK